MRTAMRSQPAEAGLTKQGLITELTKSTHGKLSEYTAIGQRAVSEEPEFFAHLTAWNFINGAIRDTKVALPVIQLSTGTTLVPEFKENALAQLAGLDPRNLLRAVRFAKEVKTPGCGNDIQRMVKQYLEIKAKNWAKWERLALQHRHSLKNLYKAWHFKPSERVDAVLFKENFPPGSVFDVVRRLKDMSSPEEIANSIIERKIPFLIASAAVGPRIKDKTVLMAIIGRMSPTELVTNAKRLEKLGVKNDPACRAAFEEALGRASKSKANLFKTTVAADSVEDESLKQKLRGLQEKQIAKLATVEGNWLVLGDKSGSMQQSIETSRHVAATLARMVKGKVHLMFFDVTPRYLDATGKTYEQLLAETRNITANGGTSIGCGLRAAMDRKLEIDGIAVVSDGGENHTPYFYSVYQELEKQLGKAVPVYLYHVDGDSDGFSFTCKQNNVDVQKFDIHGTVDYYSLPNVVQTMRTNRYGLIEEILDTPLFTIDRLLGVA